MGNIEERIMHVVFYLLTIPLVALLLFIIYGTIVNMIWDVVFQHESNLI